uniref:GIY endonuclease n=1 Tax=Orbilia brochopaga TaxID=3140254 RepID=A0A481ZN91_9PEZI|nr:GIY endonuclease [Drechslerella brochopaga]QBL02557.1 GIY endonuclease [Drechslerella brochopaga]
MAICNALIKHGYSNFSLEILEYCEAENCIEREQFYIDLYKPEYNILKFAGSNLGYKHTEETLDKLRNRKVSDEVKALLSAKFKGENNPMFGRVSVNHPMYGKTKPEGSGRSPQRIAVLDVLTNERTEYDSIGAASLALNIKQSRISMYFANNQKKPYKGRYVFQKI